MDKFIEKSKEFALDLFFPKFCLGCQKEGSYLCEDCRAVLDIAEHNYCLCETHPMRLLPNSKSGKCPKCSGKNLSGLYFALSYKEKDLTKKLIRQFKYPPYLKDLAKTLASILIEHFIKTGKNTNEIWENSVLIPVPSDKKKLKTRGYNQSEELAKELSKVLQVPVISNNLIKTKITSPQMELKKYQREKNLKNAFQMKNPAELSGKKTFLVDDVYTTGSTMEECSQVLKTAGAQTVWGIAIAREG
ncbi:MAG: ComF family protein [Candidatus Staskawiczbacteria bacterium]|nr:ComF family protein [Candidatus Staskawiczbacteria bacterium]